MKKLFLISLGLIFTALAANSQSAEPTIGTTTSYSENPVWVSMMQDPNANFFETQKAFNEYWKDRPITRGCGWKVFKRWEYMMQSRIAADGMVPQPGATYQAYTDYITNIRSSGGAWTNLGPSQIPAPGPAGYEGLGRINNVAFHPTDPDTWYIAAPSGGMWMTSDGGSTWETHTDTLPTLGVSAIVVDYTNPSIIFIGSGDRDAGDAPGLGIFKSTNGGLTWVQSTLGLGEKTIGEILMHPTNHLIMLAAANGGIYRTTDGGANWSLSATGNFKDIDFKPNDPNIVYAASGANFYRSADNGVTWTQISAGLTGGQRGTIAVTAANPNYVYFVQSNNSSGFKGLYRSADAGLTFTTRSTSPNILDWSCDGSGTGGQGWYDLALEADPLNAETIYVGGVDVWKSTNGGTTWNINSHWYGGCSVPAVHADCHMLKFSPVNGKFYACNDGGIYNTSNGGTSWTDYTETMTIGQIYKLGQAQTVKEKVINGFQDNGTYTYMLPEWLATGGGDGMECAIDYTNASWTYHTIYYGDVFRKYNNSNEKKIAGSGTYGINESGAWVTPFILHETDPETMFLGMKNVWRSNNIQDNTISWTKISDFGTGNNCVVVEQSSANTDILYVARYDNRVFRSDNCNDASVNWVEITSFLPASGYPTDIEAHPSEADVVYITMANGVFKSIDKGLSWTDITGTLPNIHISTIAYYKNAMEGLYVGTDAGVFYKDASMTDWIPFSEGLPVSVKVTELDIYYDNDSVSSDAIRASSYGRGLWGSDMYHSVPDADFSADKTTVPIGCGVNFTDLSNGVPTSWQWTFEGGTPASSNEKHPTDIVYNSTGTFLVKLLAANEAGSDSLTKTGYITVSDNLLPDVDFMASVNVVCSNEPVYLTDLTEYCPSAWSWSFSPNNVIYLQGTNSNSQNPVVMFTQNGSYSVTLTATNSVGTSSTTKEDFLMNGGYQLPFTDDFEAGFSAQFWTIDNPDNQMTWDTISVPGTSPDNKAAWMNFYNYVYMYKRDQLISPVFDFTNFTNVMLTFRHAYAQRDVLKDSLIILVSDDCGSTYTRVFAAGPDGTPNTFVTHEPMMDEFYPQSANDWCDGSYGVSCYEVDLNGFSGKPNVKIAFEAYNRRGNNLFLDDISITGTVGISPGGDIANSIRVYPNPTTGLVNISIDHLSGDALLQLLTAQGQTVISEQITGDSGRVTRQIDLGSLTKGVYFLKVTTGDASIVKKIVKE
ncbi:MAG: PKD domain-containing protein [Bacteroidales bacterium]|nr:PKD domain-containing protein [Bacteroidales bacterium]